MNCRSDEIGNRTRLKIVRRKACGFKSHLRHLLLNTKLSREDLHTLSYVIGGAIGDGNLSNPNGRATRLRITCDTKYPNIIKNITQAIQEVMPSNKVSIVHKKESCLDISCYSNKWENLLGWTAAGGSKFNQKVSVPAWIKNDKEFTANCLRGLIETDGSVYKDREYLTVNFVTIIPNLANDVMEMIASIGFKPNMQTHTPKVGETKYTIRVSRKAGELINLLGVDKS